MRALRWVFLIVLFIGLGVGAWAFARKKHSQAGGAAGGASGSASGERMVPVTVATVQKKDVAIVLEGLGSVLPLQTVTVRSQVDGRLDRVTFKEGQAVKKGEVIAQVDPRPFSIQLHNAQAAVGRDQATLNQAKLDLDRYTQLRQQNLIPQQQLDQQRTLVDQTQAALAADAAQVENARLQLDYAIIKSPIDGVTGVRQVDPGNLVHPNDATGIVIITQLDPIAVLFTLPEDDLPRVSKQLALGKMAVEAWNRDGSAKLAEGALALIDNQINQQTATMRLKAVFPNGERTLWPNQFIKARLQLSTREGAIVVPAATIQRGPQGTFAYVVNGDDTVSPRNVEVDLTQGEQTIILSGLAPGERVVTDGQNQLRPGAKISPRAPAGAPATTSAAGSAGPPSASGSIARPPSTRGARP